VMTQLSAAGVAAGADVNAPIPPPPGS